MRDTLAVWRKEVRSYVVGPIPYIVVALFSCLVFWWVFVSQKFLLMRQATLEGLFMFLPLGLAIFVPAIAMRMWSEEIRGRTLETLLTMPVRVRSLVMGKFLAGMTVVAACLLVTTGIAITAGTLGNLDMGPVWGGYFGALLMGGAFLALSLWISSRTENQIVAFLLGLFACLALAGLDYLGLTGGGGSMANLLAQVSITNRFRGIARGVIDLRDLVYFVSVIGFFLYLNVESVENRRFA